MVSAIGDRGAENRTGDSADRGARDGIATAIAIAAITVGRRIIAAIAIAVAWVSITVRRVAVAIAAIPSITLGRISDDDRPSTDARIVAIRIARIGIAGAAVAVAAVPAMVIAVAVAALPAAMTIAMMVAGLSGAREGNQRGRGERESNCFQHRILLDFTRRPKGENGRLRRFVAPCNLSCS
jgi:hypothetical protein